MSIPDIVLEDLYRRIRELEEAVRKLQKGQQVYGPTTPFPAPIPTFPSLPPMPYPTPVWSDTEASDCIYERAAKSGEPFAGICMCPKHSFISKIGGASSASSKPFYGACGGKVPPEPPATEYAAYG